MDFFPCFISFRHYGDDISESFIKQFEKCLTAELKPLVGQGPFIDFDRLNPGYSLSQRIQDALCQSACMIVIWSPQYFAKEHLWCAMEFKAMLELEKRRLELLPHNERGKKLIIPVIYRGSKYYPLQLNDTLYLNFEKFALYHSEMINNQLFADKIKNLAEYIYERIETFRENGHKPWGDCKNFNLPSKEETLSFIKGINIGRQDFPF